MIMLQKAVHCKNEFLEQECMIEEVIIKSWASKKCVLFCIEKGAVIPVMSYIGNRMVVSKGLHVGRHQFKSAEYSAGVSQIFFYNAG